MQLRSASKKKVVPTPQSVKSSRSKTAKGNQKLPELEQFLVDLNHWPDVTQVLSENVFKQAIEMFTEVADFRAQFKQTLKPCFEGGRKRMPRTPKKWMHKPPATPVLHKPRVVDFDMDFSTSPEPQTVNIFNFDREAKPVVEEMAPIPESEDEHVASFVNAQTKMTSTSRRQAAIDPDEDLKHVEFETSGGVEIIPTFEVVGLNKDLIRGIYSYGFEKPSAIQQRAIKQIMKGNDLTFETFWATTHVTTFSICALQSLDTQTRETQVLILSPTFIKSIYNSKVILALGDYMNVQCHACIGGTDVGEDMRKLDYGQHVVTGTPGRVFDMIRRSNLRTRGIKMLILDEADEMLSKGFKEQLYDIYRYLPPGVQVVLLSATLPYDVLEMTSKFMTDPVQVQGELNESEPNVEISTNYLIVHENDLKTLHEDEFLVAVRGSGTLKAQTPRKRISTYYSNYKIGSKNVGFSRDHKMKILFEWKSHNKFEKISFDFWIWSLAFEKTIHDLFEYMGLELKTSAGISKSTYLNPLTTEIKRIASSINTDFLFNLIKQVLTTNEYVKCLGPTYANEELSSDEENDKPFLQCEFCKRKFFTEPEKARKNSLRIHIFGRDLNGTRCPILKQQQKEEGNASDNEADDMENVDDIQLENDESDHEMDVDHTNEQVNEESESVDETNEQVEQTELDEEPENQVEEIPNQDDIANSNDTAQKNEAFGQTAPYNKDNCVSDSQVAAENETTEGGEQGEEVAIGEKKGESAAQKPDDTTSDDKMDTSSSASALKRNQTDDNTLGTIDENNMVDENDGPISGRLRKRKRYYK